MRYLLNGCLAETFKSLWFTGLLTVPEIFFFPVGFYVHFYLALYIIIQFGLCNQLV